MQPWVKLTDNLDLESRILACIAQDDTPFNFPADFDDTALLELIHVNSNSPQPPVQSSGAFVERFGVDRIVELLQLTPWTSMIRKTGGASVRSFGGFGGGNGGVASSSTLAPPLSETITVTKSDDDLPPEIPSGPLFLRRTVTDVFAEGSGGETAGDCQTPPITPTVDGDMPPSMPIMLRRNITDVFLNVPGSRSSSRPSSRSPSRSSKASTPLLTPTPPRSDSPPPPVLQLNRVNTDFVFAHPEMAKTPLTPTNSTQSYPPNSTTAATHTVEQVPTVASAALAQLLENEAESGGDTDRLEALVQRMAAQRQIAISGQLTDEQRREQAESLMQEMLQAMGMEAVDLEE